MDKSPCFLAEVAKENPLQLDLPKKRKSFEETLLMPEKKSFMVSITWGDMSYFSYTENLRISKAKSTTNYFILRKKL